MIYPSVNEIMKSKNIKSKYTLVVATAKRAREINETKVTFTECKSDKAVTIAIHEIYENKVNLKFADKKATPLEIDTKTNEMNDILENDKYAAEHNITSEE